MCMGFGLKGAYKNLKPHHGWCLSTDVIVRNKTGFTKMGHLCKH